MKVFSHLNTTWRFYFFELGAQKYVFDCYSNKIFALTTELYSLLNSNDYYSIKSKYSRFYKEILQAKHSKVQKSFKISASSECYVTINFSNNCNLNCRYCYRQKETKDSLNTQDLENILNYIKKIYAPKASAYIFSLCYTSESSLELSKLKYFDYLIGQNEGYLFDNSQISNKKAKKIFESLPTNLKKKYNPSENFIKSLNEILMFENLWEYFDYSEIDYLKNAFKLTKNLSYSRTIKGNRLIINNIFSKYNLEQPIKYIAQSFMTNGTNVTDEYVDFVQSILLDKIYVSIDGPKDVHNENRIYFNGNGSFSETIAGIEKLKNAGIKVVASVVITPSNIDLNKIVSYLVSIGFDEISFNLVRGKKVETQFTKEVVDTFLHNIKKLYKKFYEDYNKKIVSKELIALKNTMLFTPLKEMYYRKFVTARCTWGRDLVIDSKGNLYHCNSMIGFEKDCLGNYMSNVKRKRLGIIPSVEDFSKCRNCYAKYLCGGTCYAEHIWGNKQNEDMECYLKKELINESLKFYVKLRNASQLGEFIKVIS